MDILFDYRYLILVILGFVIYSIFEWSKTKALIRNLMLAAKSMAKDYILESGEEQKKWVLDRVYILLPKWVALLIPKEVMSRIIEYLYRMAMDYSDDGKINGSR